MKTIKNIFSKININPFFYLFGFISMITGLFKPFLIMYLIIFIHEFGHIFMALLFDYKIVKINIYPFGGYTIFDSDINNKFIKEFMVFLGGILFQTIFFLIITSINNTSYFYKIYYSYNNSILLFNMLPIIPLDGGKILNMLLNNIFSFKKSYVLSIKISYFIIILLIIFKYKNINLILMLILIIFLLIKEMKNLKYIYNRFLLERYIKNLNYKKNNFINKIEDMKKYKNNIFIRNNKYYSEKEILKKYFNKSLKV